MFEKLFSKKESTEHYLVFNFAFLVLWVTPAEGFHKTKTNSHDGSSTTKAGVQLEAVFTMLLKGEQYTVKC